MIIIFLDSDSQFSCDKILSSVQEEIPESNLHDLAILLMYNKAETKMRNKGNKK